MKILRTRDGVDVGAAPGEQVLELVEAVVAEHVEDRVETLVEVDELRLGVIDDSIGTELGDEVYVSVTAHRGDLSAQDLGDLYGEDPNAARGAVDQDVLAGLHASFVAKAL